MLVTFLILNYPWISQIKLTGCQSSILLMSYSRLYWRFFILIFISKIDVPFILSVGNHWHQCHNHIIKRIWNVTCDWKWLKLVLEWISSLKSGWISLEAAGPGAFLCVVGVMVGEAELWQVLLFLPQRSVSLDFLSFIGYILISYIFL